MNKALLLLEKLQDLPESSAMSGHVRSIVGKLASENIGHAKTSFPHAGTHHSIIVHPDHLARVNSIVKDHFSGNDSIHHSKGVYSTSGSNDTLNVEGHSSIVKTHRD